MGNKYTGERITGQTYLPFWESGNNPPPRIVNGDLEVYINGVTFYGKIIEHIPIWDDMVHVAFRFGKERFCALVQEIIIKG